MQLQMSWKGHAAWQEHLTGGNELGLKASEAAIGRSEV